MNIMEAPFLTRANLKGLPVFNDVYCWLYYHVFSGCQKMSWLLPGKEWTLDSIFNRRVLKSDGTPSDEYMLSARLVAHWDFYIVTSIYASQPHITAMRKFYDRRLAVYQALDGKEGRTDWRAVLKDKLTRYIARFPGCCDSVSKRRKSGGLAGTAADVPVAARSVDPQMAQEIADELTLF
jgi:hypothetical protein